MTSKQKAGLAKGQALMKKAREIQKKGGQKKNAEGKMVYKMTMSQALKKAAGK